MSIRPHNKKPSTQSSRTVLVLRYWFLYRILEFLLLYILTGYYLRGNDDNDGNGNIKESIRLLTNDSFSIRSVSLFGTDTPLQIYEGNLDHHSSMETILANRMARF